MAMASGGLSQRIVRLATTYVEVTAKVALRLRSHHDFGSAGLSGSAVADAATLVVVSFIPNDESSKIPEAPSMNTLLASGGIIAPVIPPSIPLILVGVAGGISIKNHS
ncbi:TRAP transporter large permease subunit [Vibrio chagasii]|nr:TRAP transporter large permease subunit [Vibrio chagasii]